jgi:hypothetical protein
VLLLLPQAASTRTRGMIAKPSFLTRQRLPSAR